MTSSLGLPQGDDDLEFWLNHCHDFLVDSESGEEIGVIDDIEFDPRTGRAVALVVTSGWFGRHIQTIAVTDVLTILPGEQRLIVKDAPAQTS